MSVVRDCGSVDRNRRSHRVYVLDDGLEGSRDEWAMPFRRSAPASGLRVVGAASWDPRGIGFRALVERIRGARADGVYLSGLAGSHGGKPVAALRARLGDSLTLIAPNPFAPTWLVYRQSGGAARGMYVTSTYVPAQRLGPPAQTFARDFAATQPGAPVFDSTAYAGAATEVLLAAIAHSDGVLLFDEKQPSTLSSDCAHSRRSGHDSGQCGLCPWNLARWGSAAQVAGGTTIWIIPVSVS